MVVEVKAETVDATKARASLGEILARARYGGRRFGNQQRVHPAAGVIGYEDYQEFMAHLQDL